MSGVVALIEANDEAAAQALVNEFSMVQNGLYRIELVALPTGSGPPTRVAVRFRIK